MGGILTEKRSSGKPGDTADESVSLATAANDCPIKVLHDVVAIVAEKGRVSSGGIIIPDNCKDRTLTGKVVAIGPGRYPDDYRPQVGVHPDKYGNAACRFPMSVAVGDTAIFPTMVGLEIEVGGVHYYMVHEGDILAVLNK